MAEVMKFDESVMVVDVAFLNRVIEDLRRNFSQILKRGLGMIDLSELVSYIALDAGLLPDSENRIQVLLIYDDLSERISYTQPSDVATELNDVAFQSGLGEFSFYAFHPEGFAGTDDFLIESIKVVLAEKTVKRLWVVAELSEKIRELQDTFKKEGADKDILFFCMSEPSLQSLKWELLGYPVMKALGIRSDELN